MIVESHSVKDPETLYQALINKGDVDDVGVTINGSILIERSALSETDINAAIADASEGSFFANKVARTKEVRHKTDLMLNDGHTLVLPTSGRVLNDVPVNLAYVVQYRAEWRFHTDGTDAGAIAYENTIGRGFALADVTDKKELYEQAEGRYKEITGNQTNADGSFGEYALIFAINTAVDQAALDAITDTRK